MEPSGPARREVPRDSDALTVAKRAPSNTKFLAAGVVFAALGEPTRLKIVARLCSDGPASIVRLSDVADVSRQAITKHLSALEAAGLVASRREGRERIWEMKTARLAEVRRHLDEISAQWDRSLGRLQALMER